MKNLLVFALVFSLVSGICFAEEISKVDRYNLTKKDATWPMVSAGLVGFGSGQMMSGETNKGLLFAAADGLVIAGILYYQPQQIGWQLLWTGALTALRVWEVVDVNNTIESQNKALRQKLEIEQ